MKNSVLGASDDPKIRELVRQAIQAEELEPVICGDGLEVLESIKESGASAMPKLIILEAFLPKVDGHEVVNQLQSNETARQIPILMLIGQKGAGTTAYQSGAISPQALTARIRLKADNYLQKPFELKEIRSEVHGMVKYYRPHNSPHPITGLPGHPQMEQEVFNRFVRGETFVTLWLDINHFRPYNDHYGANRGNEVLKMTAGLIQKLVRSEKFPENQKAFLSHVDGDDFILLVPEENADSIRQTLREELQEEIFKFYSAEEREKGFFYEKGRDKKDQIFPLMSPSMALLKVTMEKFVHYGQLVSESNELLRQTKVGAQDVK